ALRRAAKNPEPPASPAAGTTPFLVEPEKRRIRIQDQVLDLTPLEYGILKTLIERPGHVYSRDYLMDSLWSGPFHSSDRSIDQHVKTLRRKIGRVMGDAPVIVTHRGAGYALRDDW
ncbi:MAG TPA: two-component system response regulator CreB, partial [Methylococcaceae bacterium]|nr:two-component system response regulator CreB [Methylococcaceae bacterium]